MGKCVSEPRGTGIGRQPLAQHRTSIRRTSTRHRPSQLAPRAGFSARASQLAAHLPPPRLAPDALAHAPPPEMEDAPCWPPGDPGKPLLHVSVAGSVDQVFSTLFSTYSDFSVSPAGAAGSPGAAARSRACAAPRQLAGGKGGGAGSIPRPRIQLHFGSGRRPRSMRASRPGARTGHVIPPPRNPRS
jgi:hypothetical protein